PGTLRTMSASRRRPMSCFQPGMAAMYFCTGASPSAFPIWGLPPESRVGLVAALRAVRLRVAMVFLSRSRRSVLFQPRFGQSVRRILRPRHRPERDIQAVPDVDDRDREGQFRKLGFV